jgi:glutathione synthase/RimK-type ligase-like ATP-grasp enzyme
VVFGDLRHGRFLNGRILHCANLSKPEELERLGAAGIPVPDWVVIRPGTRLDPAEWGPYVVVKPTVGSSGADIRIRRTSRVRYQPPESFPPGHLGRLGPLIAQRFVYTGPWAVSFRVCTFLGRALYCLRAEQSHQKRRLEERWGFAGSASGGGIQIIAPSRTATYALADDREVIELAERAHQLAFPDYPYLGIDLVRDAESGKLWIIEPNTGGNVWHLSSKAGVGVQRAHGIDLYAQFGALDRAAERLVDATRRHAKVSPQGRPQLPFRVDR